MQCDGGQLWLWAPHQLGLCFYDTLNPYPKAIFQRVGLVDVSQQCGETERACITNRSILIEMLPKLRFVVHRGVGACLRAAYRQIRAAKQLAERGHERRVGRQAVERLVE